MRKLRVRAKAKLGLAIFWFLASSWVNAAETLEAHKDLDAVRFSISSGMFRDVNENDARASVKAYAQQLAVSRGFIVDPIPSVFTGATELSKLLKAGTVDIVSLPVSEFLLLEENLTTEPILVSVLNGLDYEEYLLLVGADSGFNRLSDLKSRRMLVLNNLQGALAECWLEVLLGEQSLGPPEQFFARVTRHFKTTQTLLPVFFHQGDACVVTRQGFTLMGELNPQVAKKLRVLAVSPPVVPHLTCFRATLKPAIKQKILTAITDATASTGGKQLMTIFQCDQVENRPLSTLRSTKDLLAARARLRGKAGGSDAALDAPNLSQPGGPGP
jgi:ABC-type phosphate/phosphonate transport system substrate-binding protein